MTLRIIMVGAEWCGACQQKKVHLERNDIDYEYYDIDSHEGRNYVQLSGLGQLPIFVLLDDVVPLITTNSVKKFISVIRQLESVKDE